MNNPTESFGWILLSVGLAIFLILLVKPLWSKQRHQSKIKINNKFIINNDQPENKKSNQIITLRFSPKIKSNFPLKEVKELFLRHNLSFNEMKIFERMDGEKELYNVANLIEPGIFEKNRDIINISCQTISSYSDSYLVLNRIKFFLTSENLMQT